jgi:hypothetical protein
MSKLWVVYWAVAGIVAAQGIELGALAGTSARKSERMDCLRIR